MPIIIVSLSFRYAAKSTAILWLPLLWIIRQTRSETSGINVLRLYVGDPQTKFALLYSLVVACGFVLKVCLLFGAWSFVQLAWLGPQGCSTLNT